MTQKEKNLITEIAKKYSYTIQERGDLESRMNDEEDYIEVSIMSIEAMLEAAYKAGKENR